MLVEHALQRLEVLDRRQEDLPRLRVALLADLALRYVLNQLDVYLLGPLRRPDLERPLAPVPLLLEQRLRLH